MLRGEVAHRESIIVSHMYQGKYSDAAPSNETVVLKTNMRSDASIPEWKMLHIRQTTDRRRCGHGASCPSPSDER